ncbi:MAG: twin-arginine translocase TatA/TatE family subunit, partial [Alphaproteobacteria bacterium]
GLTEIALILVVVLVLLGGKRIPELAKALCKAQYEYKKAKEMLQNEAKDLKDSVEKAAEEEEKKNKDQ